MFYLSVFGHDLILAMFKMFNERSSIIDLILELINTLYIARMNHIGLSK